MRRRYGYRTHAATFQRHNGSVGAYNTPDYENESNWLDLFDGSFVFGEFLGTAQGETVRGRQVTAETTNVLICEYFDATGVLPTDRMTVNGDAYSIVSVRDPDGTRREMWLEAKRESGT